MAKKLENDEKFSKVSRHVSVRRMGLAITSIALIFINLSILVFFGAWVYYLDKFLPGTIIAGVDISGNTYDEARAQLENTAGDVNNRQVILEVAGQTYHPLVSELGYGFDWQQTMERVYQERQSDDFVTQAVDLIARLAENKHVVITPEPSITSAILEQYVNAIVGASTYEAEGATIKYTDGEYIIKKEISAVEIDKDELRSFIQNELKQALDNHNYKNFQIRYDLPRQEEISGQDLTDTKVQAETIINIPIAFTYDGKIKKPTRSTKASWIRFVKTDNQIEAQIVRKEIEKYVKGLAEKVYIRPKAKLIIKKTKKVQREGTKGRALIQAQTVTDIMAVLEKIIEESENNNGLTASEQTIQLMFENVAFGTRYYKQPFKPGNYEGKYIEISISKQRMNLYKNNKKIASYLVSTGSYSRPTPLGIYYIHNKIPRAYSRMASLWMPWWNGVVDGVGIHELPEWGNGYKEGSWDLGRRVSHGCIRLGVGPAYRVYKWAPIGTPVYIHN